MVVIKSFRELHSHISYMIIRYALVLSKLRQHITHKNFIIHGSPFGTPLFIKAVNNQKKTCNDHIKMQNYKALVCWQGVALYIMDP